MWPLGLVSLVFRRSRGGLKAQRALKSDTPLQSGGGVHESFMVSAGAVRAFWRAPPRFLQPLRLPTPRPRFRTRCFCPQVPSRKKAGTISFPFHAAWLARDPETSGHLFQDTLGSPGRPYFSLEKQVPRRQREGVLGGEGGGKRSGVGLCSAAHRSLRLSLRELVTCAQLHSSLAVTPTTTPHEELTPRCPTRPTPPRRGRCRRTRCCQTQP